MLDCRYFLSQNTFPQVFLLVQQMPNVPLLSLPVQENQYSCNLFIYMLQSKQIDSLANSQFILGALIEQDSRMIQFHTEQMREEASFRN